MNRDTAAYHYRLFGNIYKKKRVIVIGNTGFKGSWLTAWLLELGAEVYGMSNGTPTTPSHFKVAGLKEHIQHFDADIRDAERVKKIIHQIRPDFVFHLAAQALVRLSYKEPLKTLNTNIMGTANILEALRDMDYSCNAVIITSDKCYDNVEWAWGYRENDSLGGKDPYSASKGAAELVIRTYASSYFAGEDSPVKIVSARAGNVIGGGDWAPDRIVPDCVRAWANNETVKLRNPKATRPWQHVLEPLSGYLALATSLSERPDLHGEAFNFGPPAQQDHTVQELVEQMAYHWKQVKWQDVSEGHGGPYESGLLKLNCDKALHHLKWLAVLDFEQTVKFTADWYKRYYQEPGKSIVSFTLSQIEEYSRLARKQNISWTL